MTTRHEAIHDRETKHVGKYPATNKSDNTLLGQSTFFVTYPKVLGPKTKILVTLFRLSPNFVFPFVLTYNLYLSNFLRFFVLIGPLHLS